jgi:NADPH-dependent 2,4-dienoyl-CoA reductase/sulfur reductase-like enzyme
VAPDPDFVYKPLMVEEPFDLGPPERHALAPLAEELGASFVRKAVKSVEADHHEVELDDGSTLPYDFLVVAPGGRFRPALEGRANVPLRRRAAAHQRDPGSEGGSAPDRLRRAITWALLLYEVALMTRGRAMHPWPG